MKSSLRINPKITLGVSLAVLATLIVLISWTLLRVQKTLDEMACFKNVVQIKSALRIYAADNRLEDRQVYEEAGTLLAKEDFCRIRAAHWRFSRDGIFPACPASPRSETQSYMGRKSSDVIWSDPFPVVWEKKPYHDNKRHVLLSDGKIVLMSEPEFRALGNPSGATSALSARPMAPTEIVTFKKQIQESITTQRPQWSQAQGKSLADLIISEAMSKTPGGLHQSDATKIMKSLEHCLSKFDSSPEEPVLKVTQEYFRWAVADFASRKEMSNEERAELEQSLRDCFSKAVTLLKNDLPSDLHGQIDQSAESNLQYAIRSMQDPLFPGLKRPIPKEKFEEFLKQCANSWQQKKAVLLGHGGANRFKTQDGRYHEIVKGAIEIPFRVLRQQIEYCEVLFDEPLKKAMEEFKASKQKEFQLRKERELGGANR
jgi:hypothetical protein